MGASRSPRVEVVGTRPLVSLITYHYLIVGSQPVVQDIDKFIVLIQ